MCSIKMKMNGHVGVHITKFVNALVLFKIVLKWRKHMKLSELKTGSRGTIAGFDSEILELKLMEMGCIPGEVVVVEQVAPLGDPMNIRVAGYMLSLRKDEADKIID